MSLSQLKRKEPERERKEPRSVSLSVELGSSPTPFSIVRNVSVRDRKLDDVRRVRHKLYMYSYTSLERISRDQVIFCLRVKMP